MDYLSKLTKDELSSCLQERKIPQDVVEEFRDNEMDGEALVTLIGLTPGPDCLKDLISKVGIRLKVYQHIKSLYECSPDSIETRENLSSTSVASSIKDSIDTKENLSSNSAASSIKETSLSGFGYTPSSSGQDDSVDILKLKEEISVLKKERDALQSEKGILMNSEGSSKASSSSSKKSTSSKPSLVPNQAGYKLQKGGRICLQVQELPNPFPIPTFRSSTEQNLCEELPISNADRKYMVQTLATVLMTYVSRPSLNDCLIVSRALLEKFPFLKDEGSERAWKFFIYTRAQNVNKGSSSGGPPKKKIKSEEKCKHNYPLIPPTGDDDVSNARNLMSMKEEAQKTNPSSQSIKSLMARTCALRRSAILNGEYDSALDYVKEYPVFKRASYAKLEFELIMQRPGMKDEFDTDFENWARAVIMYAQRNCTKNSAIQAVVNDVDLECDELLLLKCTRCLSLLLTYSKAKKSDGDIPFLMTFVPTGTPPAQAVQKGNNQPHVVVIQHDEYEQYFIAVEQCLIMETTDVATAIFLMLGSHYIFNLNYHPKVNDVMTFIQEKIAKIPSEGYHKVLSPVATTHINGISSVFKKIAEEEQSAESSSDN